MVLHTESEWMIAQPHLFDDVVERAPRLYQDSVGEPVERLMVGAVHTFEPVCGGSIEAERLDIGIFHFRRIVEGNIEQQCAAKRDIEHLHSLADCENRQPSRNRLLHRLDLPLVAG